MLNHSIEYAIADGTMYIALNEGAEKSNDEFRKDIRCIGVGPEKAVGCGPDIWGTFLKLQDLSRELKRKGYAPAKYVPPPVNGAVLRVPVPTYSIPYLQ